MSDVSQKIKLKILRCLEQDTLLVSIVPASRIFPMTVSDKPRYPFIRYGRPTVRPFEDSCGMGAEVSVSLHCFDESEYNTQRIAEIAQRAVVDLSDVVSSEWNRTVFVQDPDEASVWQAVVTLTVTDRD